MRATYRREVAVKELLTEAGIETFIPMHYVMRMRNGRMHKVAAPVVASLIFVHTTKNRIQAFKAGLPHLQYLTTVKNGNAHPIIVPDRQMEPFIAVCGSLDEQLLYLSPEELPPARGSRVRIHGGELDGREGIFMRVKGTRDRRFVVVIEGVIAVATALIHPSRVEVIKS